MAVTSAAFVAVPKPLRLTRLSYDEAGRLVHPHLDDRADESVLTDHLEQAKSLLGHHPAEFPEVAPGQMPQDFDALRWFPLPAASMGVTRS